MKSILICLLLLAGVTITSFGEDPERSPSEAIQIRWQHDINKLVEGTNAPPPILYVKSPTTTNAVVLMKVNFSYINNDGAKETENGDGKLLECTVPGKTGAITNTAWFFATKIGLVFISRLQGTGTVHVALFESLETPPQKQPQYGRQLSNWLDLPVSLAVQ